MNIGMMTAASGIILLMLCLRFYVNPQLELKCEQIEVKQNELVDAGQYIKTYSSHNGRVLLPEIDTAECGDFVVVYTLIQGNKEINRELFVKVKNIP